MKYICLRDDDTSFFTTIDELRKGYGEFWGTIPVTLAVIPFEHGSERKILDYDLKNDKFRMLRKWQRKASAEELSEYHKVYPVGDNRELIEELKYLFKNNKVEIAQHGVFHRYNERGGELFADEMAYVAIRDGKEYLEKVFSSKVMTFIPPSNTIDEGCLNYVERLDMHLFCSGSIQFKSLTDKVFAYMKDPVSVAEILESKLIRRKLPIHRRLGIYMFGSITYNIFDNENEIIHKVIKNLDECGFAALGTHYRLLADIKYRSHYHHILSILMDRGDIEFVTANQYYQLMMEKFHG